MNRFTKNLTSIKPVLFTALVIACLLAAALPVRAATGRLYLTPTTTSVVKDGEVTVALRIDPGTEINGVGAEILYDVGKLSFVGLDDSGTSFPYILETDISSGKFKMIRATEGSVVTSDSLVFKLVFKALASSGSTAFTITGNAGKDDTLTNPQVESASVTFAAPASSTPGSTNNTTSGSKPSATTPTQSGTATPGTTTQPTNNATPQQTAAAQQTPQEKAAAAQPEVGRKNTKTRSKAWIVFAVLALLVLATHIYLTVKDYRSSVRPAAPPVAIPGPIPPVISAPVAAMPPIPTPPVIQPPQPAVPAPTPPLPQPQPPVPTNPAPPQPPSEQTQ